WLSAALDQLGGSGESTARISRDVDRGLGRRGWRTLYFLPTIGAEDRSRSRAIQWRFNRERCATVRAVSAPRPGAVLLHGRVILCSRVPGLLGVCDREFKPIQVLGNGSLPGFDPSNASCA